MVFDFNKQPGLQRRGEVEKINRPYVSIITPFYNAGKYFEQTYNCVMNQTFIWFEWIIVDDGSTNKEDVLRLKRFVDSDVRIKLYQIHNSGPAAARNYAISKANTELIVPLDADDLIEPTYLEITYFALQFHPEATWAYTDSLGFENMEYIWRVPFDSSKLKKRNFLINIGMFRKQAFYDAGKYDDAQKYSHEDWKLWLQFILKGGFPVHISSLSAWYRILNNGALHKTNDNKTAKKRAYNRVKEVAFQITNRVDAVEYPRINRAESEIVFRCSNWRERKTKNKKEVLLMIPEMKEDKNLDLAANISIMDDIQLGIMVTEKKSTDYFYQVFRDYSDSLYELPSFLDISDYSEFLSYYIQSRQVDAIIISDSTFGYCTACWLAQNFPDIVVVDAKMNPFSSDTEFIRNLFSGEGDATMKNYIRNSQLSMYSMEHLRLYNDLLYLKKEKLEIEQKLHPLKILEKKLKLWMFKQTY